MNIVHELILKQEKGISLYFRHPCVFLVVGSSFASLGGLAAAAVVSSSSLFLSPVRIF